MAAFATAFTAFVFMSQVDISIFMRPESSAMAGGDAAGPSQSPEDTYVRSTTADEWYVIEIPRDANSMYYALGIIATGSAWVDQPMWNKHLAKVGKNERGAQSMRSVFESYISKNRRINPHAMADINRNMLCIANSNGHIEKAYDELQESFRRKPGNENTLKLFSFFTGHPIHVLYAITSQLDSLDWGTVMWDGGVFTGGYDAFDPRKYLGPPFALLYEQDSKLAGKRWNLLLTKDLFSKFVESKLHTTDVWGRPVDYNIGKRLTQYLAEVKERAIPAGVPAIKQGANTGKLCAM